MKRTAIALASILLAVTLLPTASAADAAKPCKDGEALFPCVARIAYETCTRHTAVCDVEGQDASAKPCYTGEPLVQCALRVAYENCYRRTGICPS